MMCSLTAQQCSYDEQVDEFVDRSSCEPRIVERDLEDSALLLRWKTASEIGLEFFDQQRDSFLAPAAVPDRILYDDFLELATILEFDGDRVGDRALVRIEIVLREPRIFD